MYYSAEVLCRDDECRVPFALTVSGSTVTREFEYVSTYYVRLNSSYYFLPSEEQEHMIPYPTFPIFFNETDPMNFGAAKGFSFSPSVLICEPLVTSSVIRTDPVVFYAFTRVMREMGYCVSGWFGQVSTWVRARGTQNRFDLFYLSRLIPALKSNIGETIEKLVAPMFENVTSVSVDSYVDLFVPPVLDGLGSLSVTGTVYHDISNLDAIGDPAVRNAVMDYLAYMEEVSVTVECNYKGIDYRVLEEGIRDYFRWWQDNCSYVSGATATVQPDIVFTLFSGDETYQSEFSKEVEKVMGSYGDYSFVGELNKDLAERLSKGSYVASDSSFSVGTYIIRKTSSEAIPFSLPEGYAFLLRNEEMLRGIEPSNWRASYMRYNIFDANEVVPRLELMDK